MTPDPRLLQALSPDVRVVVWAGDAALGEDTPGFVTLDYLMDGLVRSHLREGSAGPHQLLFVHTLHDAPFWAAYVDTSALAPGAFLPAFLELLPAQARAQVLVLEAAPMSNAWEKALSQGFASVNRLALQ